MNRSTERLPRTLKNLVAAGRIDRSRLWRWRWLFMVRILLVIALSIPIVEHLEAKQLRPGLKSTLLSYYVWLLSVALLALVAVRNWKRLMVLTNHCRAAKSHD
jgi:hypothetical protein